MAMNITAAIIDAFWSEETSISGHTNEPYGLLTGQVTQFSQLEVRDHLPGAIVAERLLLQRSAV